MLIHGHDVQDSPLPPPSRLAVTADEHGSDRTLLALPKPPHLLYHRDATASATDCVLRLHIVGTEFSSKVGMITAADFQRARPIFLPCQANRDGIFAFEEA